MNSEEDLEATAEDGKGFFPAYIGQKLKDGRYTIVRKLKFDENATCWLVKDAKPEEPRISYYAINIFSSFYTSLNRTGQAFEASVLQALRDSPDSWGSWPELLDSFDIESLRGTHICLVHPTFGETLTDLRLTFSSKRLPLHLVKLFVSALSSPFNVLASLGIVYGALRPDRIRTASPMGDEQIEEQLTDATDAALKQITSIVSAPLRSHYRWDELRPYFIELWDVYLMDFSLARPVDNAQSVLRSLPEEWQAPEVLLHGAVSTAVDVWSLGCLTYELLTGKALFQMEEGPTWTATDARLARMQHVAQEPFPMLLLAHSVRKDEFFDEVGNLLRPPADAPFNLEQDLLDHGVLFSHAGPAATFIQQCLALDPAKRPSPEGIVDHKWLKGAAELEEFIPVTA